MRSFRAPANPLADPSADPSAFPPLQRGYAKKHFDSGSIKPLMHAMQGVFVIAFGLEARGNPARPGSARRAISAH